MWTDRLDYTVVPASINPISHSTKKQYPGLSPIFSLNESSTECIFLATLSNINILETEIKELGLAVNDLKKEESLNAIK